MVVTVMLSEAKHLSAHRQRPFAVIQLIAGEAEMCELRCSCDVIPCRNFPLQENPASLCIMSQPFKQSGDNTQTQTENIYAFVAQDNLTGLHIVRNGDEQAVGGMINVLLGGTFTCNTGDTSVPSQVTVGGVIWSQADIVCMVASSYYEVRELAALRLS